MRIKNKKMPKTLPVAKQQLRHRPKCRQLDSADSILQYRLVGSWKLEQMKKIKVNKQMQR